MANIPSAFVRTKVTLEVEVSTTPPIELPVTEQICDCCQSSLDKIGESRSEKLEFVPAHIKVIKTVRPK